MGTIYFAPKNRHRSNVHAEPRYLPVAAAPDGGAAQNMVPEVAKDVSAFGRKGLVFPAAALISAGTNTSP
jgi:hypothetical protein